MVSVLVVNVLVDDDGPQALLEVADRLRISQTVPRRQSLADSPLPSRSGDLLMNVADSLSTLACVLDPLGGRES